MVRLATPDDAEELLGLVIASGLFPESEVETLEGMFADYLDDEIENGHQFPVEEENGLRGIAYYAPEIMTDGTWNLLLLAVRPDYQRQGIGARLVQSVENALKADGQRLLLIETSGLPEFEQARSFYLKCGYAMESRIKDYYAAGDDMITYSKNLSAA